MAEINQKVYYNSPPPAAAAGNFATDESFIIEAHTSKNMKVTPPRIVADDVRYMPPDKKYYSDKEADIKIQTINTDIYTGTKKEKADHEFNKKRYFTIFSIIALLTAAIGYFGKK